MSWWPGGWLGHGARTGSGQAGLQQTWFPQPLRAQRESTAEPERLFIILIHHYYSSGGSLLPRQHGEACALHPASARPSPLHPQGTHRPCTRRLSWPRSRLSGRALVPLSLHIHHSARFCPSYAQLSSLVIAFLAASLDPPPTRPAAGLGLKGVLRGHCFPGRELS